MYVYTADPQINVRLQYSRHIYIIYRYVDSVLCLRSLSLLTSVG